MDWLNENYQEKLAESYAQNQLFPGVGWYSNYYGKGPAGGGGQMYQDAQAVRRHEMAPEDYAALYGTTFHGGEAAALAMAMSTRGANIDQIAYWLDKFGGTFAGAMNYISPPPSFAATLACRNCDEMDVLGLTNGGDQLCPTCPNPLGYKNGETVSADGNDYVLYGNEWVKLMAKETYADYLKNYKPPNRCRACKPDTREQMALTGASLRNVCW